MRDPPATREEIVEEIEAIIFNLKPLNGLPLDDHVIAGGPFRAKSSASQHVHEIVAREIDSLIESVSQGWSPTNEAKEAALKLKKPLDALIQALENVPASNVFALWTRYYGLPKLLCDFRHLLAAMDCEIPPKNTDLTKRCCAVTAFKLISMLSVDRPTTTEDGPMRAIAGLLYEIATGERDADLKRACDTCLKKKRARHVRYGLSDF
jgi:hypothetical protein